MKKFNYIILLVNLIKLIDSIDVKLTCNIEHETCYHRLSSDDQIKESDQIPLGDDFAAAIKFDLLKPNEFSQNKDGNPFSRLKLMFYIDKSVTKPTLIKIKNVNKDKQSQLKNASELDSVYEYPEMIFAIIYNAKDKDKYKNYKFVFTIEAQKSMNSYWYAEFDIFALNKYIDFFKNEFYLDFGVNDDLDSLLKKKSNFKVTKFKYDSGLYKAICSEIRLEDGSSAEQYKQNNIKKLKDKNEKQRQSRMSLVDWFRDRDLMKYIGSICAEIEVGCFSDDCRSFMKIEKLDSKMYQFHFFVKKQVAFYKASFFSNKQFAIRYEITCERFSKNLDHRLNINDQSIDVNNYLKDFNSKNTLIYSTDQFFYCGILIPINKSFKINHTRLEFDLDNQSILELESGAYTPGMRVVFEVLSSFNFFINNLLFIFR